MTPSTKPAEKWWFVFDGMTGNGIGGTTDAREAREWRDEIGRGEWGEVYVVVTKGDQTLDDECYSYPKERPRMSGPMKDANAVYVAKRNKYGGYEVWNEATGNLAPRPNGYNQRENAERRAEELNQAGKDVEIPSRSEER